MPLYYNFTNQQTNKLESLSIVDDEMRDYFGLSKDDKQFSAQFNLIVCIGTVVCSDDGNINFEKLQELLPEEESWKPLDTVTFRSCLFFLRDKYKFTWGRY